MRPLILRIVRPGVGVSELTNDLLLETWDTIVSSFTFRGAKPLVIDRVAVMAAGYGCLLFELARENLEVIAVFDRSGRLTGYYVNLNSEPRRFDGGYEITDWFLDVWVFPDLRYRVLDVDEFDAAVAAGALPPEIAAAARTALARVERDIATRSFPPAPVRDYLRTARVRTRKPRGVPAARR